TTWARCLRLPVGAVQQRRCVPGWILDRAPPTGSQSRPTPRPPAPTLRPDVIAPRHEPCELRDFGIAAPGSDPPAGILLRHPTNGNRAVGYPLSCTPRRRTSESPRLRRDLRRTTASTG